MTNETTFERTVLEESAGEQLKKDGKRWLVTIARPGKGMTGTYPEEVLKNTGPTAFPPGTKAFFKHANPQDRDVRDMVGTYPEGAFWNDEAGELQGYLQPFPRYSQILEEAGSNIEASVRVSADKDVYTGTVRELVYARDNSIDLVAFGGLEGSGLKYQVESLFSSAIADDKLEEEKQMEIEKEIAALRADIDKLGTTITAALEGSKQEAQGVADEKAVNELVSSKLQESLAAFAELDKAITAAPIPVTLQESLRERARQGEDVTNDLKTTITIVEESLKAVTPQVQNRANVVIATESLSSGANADASLKVQGWGK